MFCYFFSLEMLLRGEMLSGEHDDGTVAEVIIGLRNEENQ